MSGEDDAPTRESVLQRCATVRDALTHALPHLLSTRGGPVGVGELLSVRDAAFACQQSGTQFGVLTKSGGYGDAAHIGGARSHAASR